MSDLSCSSNNSIIDLYTDLANNPEKDFGWDKGMNNTKNYHLPALVNHGLTV